MGGRVRIVSDGTGTGTVVYVDGQELPCRSVVWDCEAGQPATAQLVVDGVPVEVEAPYSEITRRPPPRRVGLPLPAGWWALPADERDTVIVLSDRGLWVEFGADNWDRIEPESAEAIALMQVLTDEDDSRITGRHAVRVGIRDGSPYFALDPL
jgi:hypothetical protein